MFPGPRNPRRTNPMQMRGNTVAGVRRLRKEIRYVGSYRYRLHMIYKRFRLNLFACNNQYSLFTTPRYDIYIKSRRFGSAKGKLGTLIPCKNRGNLERTFRQDFPWSNITPRALKPCIDRQHRATQTYSGVGMVSKTTANKLRTGEVSIRC